MMFKRFFFLLFSAFALLSCQTIHYVNGEESGGAPPLRYETAQWHHIGLLRLVEFSPPVNVKSICGKEGWRAVRTQTNIAQGVVQNIAPAVLSAVSQGLGSLLTFLYTPEEVSVSCADPSS